MQQTWGFVAQRLALLGTDSVAVNFHIAILVTLFSKFSLFRFQHSFRAKIEKIRKKYNP